MILTEMDDKSRTSLEDNQSYEIPQNDMSMVAAMPQGRTIENNILSLHRKLTSSDQGMHLFFRSNSATKFSDREAQSRMNPLPDDYILSQNDVLFGKGKICSKHSGNQTFRNLVHNNLEEYSRMMTKKSKTLMIQNIVHSVHKKQGKFIKYDMLALKYYEASDLLAHEKVSQAFRDALYVLEKSNKRKIKTNNSEPVVVQRKRKKSECSEKDNYQRNITSKLDTLLPSNEIASSNTLENFLVDHQMSSRTSTAQNSCMPQSNVGLNELMSKQWKSEPQVPGHTWNCFLPLNHQTESILQPAHMVEYTNYSNHNVIRCLQEQASIDNMLKASESCPLRIGDKVGDQIEPQVTPKTSSNCISNKSGNDAVVFDKLALLANNHYTDFPHNDDNPFEPRPL